MTIVSRDSEIDPTQVDRSSYQDRRRAFLAGLVDIAETRGIEFGGFDLPTVPPDLGDCVIADVRSEIRLAQEFGFPLDTISPVDCIVEPGVENHRQIRDRFDYVALCHVLEHIPDVITTINDLGRLLLPGGILFIALPDKRETPDASRNSTTLARLVERQLDHATAPSLSELAEFSLAWNEEYRQLYAKCMGDFFHSLRSDQLFGDPDVHCNVWRDDEFIEQLHELIRGEYIENLEIVGSQPTEAPFIEFYVALRRIEPEVPKERQSPLSPRRFHFRTCNFCGSGRFEVWKRLHSPFPETLYSDSDPDPTLGREVSLQYLTCRNCNLTAINPLPDFDIIDRARFRVHDALSMSDDELNRLIKDRERVTEILSAQYDFEHYRQTGRLLDVSCGPGIGLAWLREHHGWEVRGTEPAREFVDFAAQRFGLDVWNGLVQDLPEAPGSFDVVMIDSSLQYTFDPLDTLLACHRLLREGGCLFIQVPNRDGLGTMWLDSNVQWGHWFFFTPAVLHRVLGRVGFESERILAIQNPVDPRVLEALPEDEIPAPESLEVTLSDRAEIDRYFENGGTPHADFFGISARRLPDGDRILETDAKLPSLVDVSRASRRQRFCIAIDPDTQVRWPWEATEADEDPDSSANEV